MSFGSLRKNDVLFCESKGSRVVKLVESNNNVWIGRDMFSGQSIEITENDTFKLVNKQRKTKPMSMVSLLESESSSRPTLTEKEVFIVEFFLDNYSQEELSQLSESYYNGDYLKGHSISVLKSLKKYLNIGNRGADDDAYMQYVLCANDNYGKEISTSTPISRFVRYSFNWIEEREQTEYASWTVDFSAEADNQELLDEFVEKIKDDFWNYNPDHQDTDYGDSHHVGMTDPELTRPYRNDRPFIIE